MKKANLLFLCMIALISCNEKQDLNLASKKDGAGKEIVLKERDSRYPLILSKKKTKSRDTKSIPTLSFTNYLGRSYTSNHFPLGDPEDIKIQIINIEKLMKDYPDYFWKNDIGKGDAQSFAYTGFDRYTENSSTTKKVKNAGFTLNLGLFSFGAHKTMTEVFTTSKVEESKRIFGELNIQIRDASYYMQTSSNIIKKITLDYLTDNFKEELYNITPSEFFNIYGGFVLSSFITGGRATALYTGIYQNNESTETKEKNMNTDISASCGFKFKEDKDGNVSVEGGIGKDYSHATTSTNKIEALETSVKTIGGSPLFSSFSIPTSIDNVNVNLSQWVSSLSDKSTHRIIDVADGGLIPLSDLILEQNLKDAFIQYYTYGINKIESLQEPHIKIIIYPHTPPIVEVLTFLYTRFGNYILIKGTTIHSALIESTIAETVNYLDKYFGLKIIQEKGLTPSTKFILGNIDFSTMKKFINPNNRITYLLFTSNNRQYAFSIYNKTIQNNYAFKDFINNLPEIQINQEDLLNYTIIAL